MIKWGEEMRKKDKGYFCRLAIREAENHHDVWIISDARRKSDIEYFKKEYPKQMVTVRVEADLEIRIRRGLVPTKGEIWVRFTHTDHSPSSHTSIPSPTISMVRYMYITTCTLTSYL